MFRTAQIIFIANTVPTLQLILSFIWPIIINFSFVKHDINLLTQWPIFYCLFICLSFSYILVIPEMASLLWKQRIFIFLSIFLLQKKLFSCTFFLSHLLLGILIKSLIFLYCSKYLNKLNITIDIVFSKPLNDKFISYSIMTQHKW